MNTGIVASRYAKALLRFAEENQEESRVYQEMLQLRRSFQQVNTLTAALLNPIFSNEKKVELLTAASLSPECKDASTSTRRFLQLVVEKKRTEMMPFIATSFVRQYEHLRNIVAKRTAGVVNLDVRIDPSLRAGFILQFDDNRMDASLRGKIERLRHQLRLPSRAQ